MALCGTRVLDLDGDRRGNTANLSFTIFLALYAIYFLYLT